MTNKKENGKIENGIPIKLPWPMTLNSDGNVNNEKEYLEVIINT